MTSLHRSFFCIGLFAALTSHADVLTTCSRIAEAEPMPSDGYEICITGKVQASYPSHPVAAPEKKNSTFCITDATGGAYVLAPTNMTHAAGDVVAISGKLKYIDYIGLSVIIPRHMTVLRHETPEPPADTSLREIREGSRAFHVVSTTGLVIDAFHDELDPRWNWLLVCEDETSVPLAVFGEKIQQDALDALIGRTIAATGLCAPSTGRRRFICPIMRIADMSDIRVCDVDPKDVFDVPFLTQSTSVKSLKRYRLRGFVLATWSERRLFVQPKTGKAVEVKLKPGVPLPHVGDFVEVSGFAKTDIFTVRLTQSILRRMPTTESFTPRRADVTPQDLIVSNADRQRIETDFHGKLIRITGIATTPPKEPAGDSRLLLNCDGHIIPLDVSTLNTAPALAIEPGSTVAATGICLLELDTDNHTSALPRVKGFRLIPRNSGDIVVLMTPPWWTSGRLLMVIGILLILLLTIVVWNITLRVIAERRGRELFRENVAHISADLRTEERTRLAVDLHDSLAQMLTGVSFQIDAGDLALASKALKSCRDELRNCLWDLRNQTLEERDMGEAIRRTLKPHIGAAQLVVRFNVPRAKLSDSTAHSVLMIIRELATNAVRHGRAKTIRVAGGLDADELRFSVRDDGCGFDPEKQLGMAEGHFGLQGIRERVKRSDGMLSIDSAPGTGTKVTVSLKRQK